VDNVDRKCHPTHGVPNIGDFEFRLNVSLNFVVRRHLETTRSLYYGGLDFCSLHADYCLDEGRDVEFRQMVNVVAPVAESALLLPASQLAWVDPSKVAHEDVKAAAVCKVGNAAVPTVDDPCLGRVEDAVHEENNIEGTLVGYSVELNDVPISSLALVTRMFVASVLDEVSNCSRVHVLLH